VSKNQPLVLVVDDEESILEMIRFVLEQAGMKALTAATPYEAVVLIDDHSPDLILMDWMMPGVSGIDLTRRLRKDEKTRDIPILMLTARVTEDDIVTGLEAGADDYLIKPFSPRELQARIKALLRRSSPADENGQLVSGRLRMDLLSRKIHCGDEEIRLGPTDFRLLEFLMTHPGRVYSRAQLLDHVWGANAYVEERTVDVHVGRVRKALEKAGVLDCLQTARGHGYLFEPGGAG
jgi:two-component system phosphate regulon response regulator PhoB